MLSCVSHAVDHDIGAIVEQPAQLASVVPVRLRKASSLFALRRPSGSVTCPPAITPIPCVLRLTGWSRVPAPVARAAGFYRQPTTPISNASSTTAAKTRG